MGIHRLLPFLKSKGLLKPFQGWPEGSKVAIDVPIFAYKFIYTERTYDSLEKRFIAFAEELRTKKCEPIFVFDGAKLPLKNAERTRRNKVRNRTQELNMQKASAFIESITDHIDITITGNVGPHGPVGSDGSVGPLGSIPIGLECDNEIALLDFKGIMFPTAKEYETLQLKLEQSGYLTKKAKYEAEALCAHLVQTDEAWCALTEDTDAIAFGSKRTILKYFSSEPIEANLELILSGLEMTRPQFIELCCLFGCDFCNNIFMVGPEGSYKLLKKYGTIENVFESKQYSWPKKTLESATELMQIKKTVFDCFESSCYET